MKGCIQLTLECPRCFTKYAFDLSKLPAEGKMVRCAKCQNTWRQKPPVVEEVGKSQEDSTTQETEAAVPPIRAKRDFGVAKPQESLSKRGWLKWVIYVLIITILFSSVVVFRQGIVGFWPPSARLYSMIGLPVIPKIAKQFVFEKVHFQPDSANATQILVRGTLKNISAQKLEVPTIRLMIQGAKSARVQQLFFAQEEELDVGASTSFETKIPKKLFDPKKIYLTLSG